MSGVSPCVSSDQKSVQFARKLNLLGGLGCPPKRRQSVFVLVMTTVRNLGKCTHSSSGLSKSSCSKLYQPTMHFDNRNSFVEEWHESSWEDFWPHGKSSSHLQAPEWLSVELIWCQNSHEWCTLTNLQCIYLNNVRGVRVLPSTSFLVKFNPTVFRYHKDCV